MEQASKINFYRKRNFIEKIEVTFAFFGRNFKSFFSTMLVIVGPFLLIAGIGAAMAMAQATQYMTTPTVNPLDMFNTIGPGMLISSISSVISGLLIFAGTFGYLKVYHQVDQGQVTTRAVWKETLRLIPGQLLFALILIGIGAVSVLVLKGFAIIVVLIFMIISVFWTIVPPIMAFEGLNPFEAMGRSFSLMGDKYFSTLGLIFVLTIITSSAIAILSILPTYALSMGRMFTMIEQENMGGFEQSLFEQIYSVVINVIGNLLSTIITVGLAFQYFNLRERKEGVGIMDQINQMGNNS